ncbi:MAG: M15 family metallopeptidase [Desulfovibrionaceae bacterium]|nr:M15 family metallopeptidase [Desulfovibrionaceae bacterium]
MAFDIGAKQGATYWRWCKLRPHPLQQTYPHEIVKSFEDTGFIWGGKWHEYDIMHFEYRPELICKARKLRNQTNLVR